MIEPNIFREVGETVRAKIRDGEIPEHIKTWAVENATDEESSAALDTWVDGQMVKVAAEGGPFTIESIVERAKGDELLHRRTGGWLDSWKKLVTEKMIEEEMDRLVQTGELGREINEDGGEVFWDNRPESNPDGDGTA